MTEGGYIYGMPFPTEDAELKGEPVKYREITLKDGTVFELAEYTGDVQVSASEEPGEREQPAPEPASDLEP
jgi:hypothetical protein